MGEKVRANDFRPVMAERSRASSNMRGDKTPNFNISAWGSTGGKGNTLAKPTSGKIPTHAKYN